MIPANDAFQLSLKHEPNRLGLHSSAKLPFLSGARRSQSPVSTRATAPTSSERPAMATRRTSATSSANGNAHAVGNGHSPQQPAPTATPNGHATAPAAKHARKGSRSAAKAKVAVVHRSWSEKIIHEWEIPRKVLHSSIGFLTLYLYYSRGSPEKVVVALASGLAVIVPCDVLRLRSTRFERLFEGTVGFLMRESEKKSTNGVIWYILGVMFALAVYPIDLAVVSILILSWADTTASTVGRLFGARTPKLPARLPVLPLPLAPRKSVAGFAAATLTGAAIAIGFWGWVVPSVGAQSSWHWPEASGWLGLGVLGVVAGLISGVTEALDLGNLDDNLTLPILSGGCLWGFFKLVEALGA